MSLYDLSDQFSSEDDDLSERLYGALETSQFDKNPREFLPEGVLGRLVTELSIRDAMNLDSGDDSLIQFIETRAKKVFATVVSTTTDSSRLYKAMLLFQKHGIDDTCLPIESPQDNRSDMTSSTDTDQSSISSVAISVFASLESGIRPRDRLWRKAAIGDFCRNQWRYLAPVFSTDSRANAVNYKLPMLTVLPFVTKQAAFEKGSFGKVSKFELHPNHINGLPDQGTSRPKVVAVKEILPGASEDREQMKTHWESEIRALERMNDLNNNHIVRFLTAFRRCDNEAKDHYLMFEWANGGNLRNLWESNAHPGLSVSTVQDVCRQLLGLADALSVAHDLSRNSSYRHGDLKPANILRFTDTVDKATVGILKIGDWGEAKEHGIVTEFRFDRTSAAYGTRRYEPPEVLVGVNPKFLGQSRMRRSRLYDVWAMGCISLEFIVWLLYGSDGLKQFIREFPEDSPFYQVSVENGEDFARVHEVATRWINHMTLEPLCKVGTALGSLLELIKDGLLVVKLPRRTGTNISLNSASSEGLSVKDQSQNRSKSPKKAATHHESFEIPFRQASLDSFSSHDPNLPSVNIIPPVESRTPVPSKPEPSGPARLLASDFKKRMELIMSEEEEEDDSYWFVDSKTSPVPPKNDLSNSISGDLDSIDLSQSSYRSGPTRNTRGASWDGLNPPDKTRVDYGRPNLDEKWEFHVDNKFAERIFASLKKPSLLTSRGSIRCPRFCSNCNDMRQRLWLPGFNITYTTTSIFSNYTTNKCDLCHLLWKVCLRCSVTNQHIVTFDRIASMLRLSGARFPVLSIVRSIDLRTPAAENFQIGFSKLPKAGSSTHIKVMQEWIRECNTNSKHSICRPAEKIDRKSMLKKKMPTRVIDVGVNGGDSVYLRETKFGDCDEWIALSHQWGPGPHFSTTRQNISAHMAGMDFNTLPNTFRDAVTITRSLGLQYLWIDSLCVIQGKDGDFNQEAKRMEDVYSGAYLVIAASCSISHYSGFLRPRYSRESVAVNAENEAPYYLCEMIDDFETHVLNGALNARGWVMQEHALARRTIFFTEYQTYWECGGGVCCESMTKMTNNLAASVGDPNFPQILTDAPQGERILRYQKLYEDYSRLALTNAFDRPMAIDGLQRRLLRTLNTKGGFGVFDEGPARGLLCRSLLWCRGSDMNSKSLERIRFPVDRAISAVPSWSWMAYTGGIDYLKLGFNAFEWKVVLPPWSQNVGSISQTQGTSSGMALVGEAREYETGITANVGDDHLLVFDEIGGSNRPKTFCVVLGIERRMVPDIERKHYLLLVKKTQVSSRDGGKIYERVGAGFLPGRCIAKSGFSVTIH